MPRELIDPFRPPELEEVLHAMRPSEYTAALIQVLWGMRRDIRGAYVIEVGSGSGVILAALAGLGAGSLYATDVEPDALRAGAHMLKTLGVADRCTFKLGRLWQPAEGKRFDLVVANLPQFPADGAVSPDRRRSWSEGGPDGRRLLDPFLAGLSLHLSPEGRAVMTHNAFIDLGRSRAILKQYGLTARIVRTVMLAVPPERIGKMTPHIRQREEGRSIHTIGPYTFARMHVICIRAAPQRR